MKSIFRRPYDPTNDQMHTHAKRDAARRVEIDGLNVKYKARVELLRLAELPAGELEALRADLIQRLEALEVTRKSGRAGVFAITPTREKIAQVDAALSCDREASRSEVNSLALKLKELRIRKG